MGDPGRKVRVSREMGLPSYKSMGSLVARVKAEIHGAYRARALS